MTRAWAGFVVWYPSIPKFGCLGRFLRMQDDGTYEPDAANLDEATKFPEAAHAQHWLDKHPTASATHLPGEVREIVEVTRLEFKPCDGR